MNDEEIVIPQHAIDQWMLRSGTKNPRKARKRLRAMLRNSEEVELKPEYRAIQLLNHGLQEAQYFLYRTTHYGRKWILVVANNELKDRPQRSLEGRGEPLAYPGKRLSDLTVELEGRLK